MKRLIVAMTGATGTIFGIRLLEALGEAGVETHLVVSKWAQQTLEHETDLRLKDLHALASVVHNPGDMAATIASGSFATDGMVIAPCSMRTLGAIAQGAGSHLVHRAADVVLKERRKLVLLVREAPLSEIHLANMLTLARMGAVIFPPVPAFYNRPKDLAAVIDHIVMRLLDQFDVAGDLAPRWAGRGGGENAKSPETGRG